MKVGKIARVGKIGLRGRVKPARVEEGITGGGIKQLDTAPEGLREVERRIGQERARRVWKLMGRVTGTLPELCTYDWLERRKIAFDFQSAQMGGRLISGGAIVDFVISELSSNGLYVWRVQGEYWHQGPDVVLKDETQRARLLRLKIGGVPVVGVVDLWENDVYDRYPEVFTRAEFGVELRRVA